MARCGNCGSSVSDTATTCPRCGAHFQDDSGAQLLGAVIGFLFVVMFIYMPFFLVGILTFFYAWAQAGLTIPISLGVGLGAFLALMAAVRLLGRLADSLPSPVHLIPRTVEVIVVTGFQFLFVLSLAFSLFMPGDVREDLLREQLEYLEAEGHLAVLQEQLQKSVPDKEKVEALMEGDLPGGLDIFPWSNSEVNYRETMGIYLESQKHYLSSLLGAAKGDQGLNVLLGLGFSVLAAAAAAFIIWRIYRGGRRRTSR